KNNKNAVLEKIKINDLKSSPVVLKYDDMKFSDELNRCLRIWPQDNDTEGFFISKIKKLTND
ncbi:MAG: tRNA methyltransferase, partial [Candidatus Woesearchaeota archaeon]